eukprot:1591851-Rhodomonas_salina.2
MIEMRRCVSSLAALRVSAGEDSELEPGPSTTTSSRSRRSRGRTAAVFKYGLLLVLLVGPGLCIA